MHDYPILNETENGYLLHGEPWPGRTFDVAMSFHAPDGIAAVRDETGAYHLDLEGTPCYEARFLETYGFYEGIAAVRDERGWFHILPDGSALHDRRFRWSGNFQGHRCVVQDSNGFFHLTREGADAYRLRFRYAGDFRYGAAVAHGAEGAFHIRPDGSRLNASTHIHAEPFHKGHAVVADEAGFFHVDRTGTPLLPSVRFRSAEPFYNGIALCRGDDGGLLRLRPNGNWTRVPSVLAPIPMAEVGRLAEEGRSIGLFLRHSDRAPITPQSTNWGNDVLLTDQGIRKASELGEALASWGIRLEFWSSPVARCCQTCEAMADGAGVDPAMIEVHRYLGDPGICFDGSGAHEGPMRADYHTFAQRYLEDGVAPGMRFLPEASEELLAFLRQRMSPRGCTVFITHDLFAAALMSFLGLKAPDRNDWCDYLEGVCLIDDGSRMTCRRFVHEGGKGQC
jgi:broad specificity phosphatase PhoE